VDTPKHGQHVAGRRMKREERLADDRQKLLNALGMLWFPGQ
jgi:hypothetical protein